MDRFNFLFKDSNSANTQGADNKVLILSHDWEFRTLIGTNIDRYTCKSCGSQIRFQVSTKTYLSVYERDYTVISCDSATVKSILE